MSALKKAKELNSDIFGFGEAVHENYPNEWKHIENNWDEIFKKLDVEVMVDSNLQRTGRITKPLTSKQE